MTRSSRRKRKRISEDEENQNSVLLFRNVNDHFDKTFNNIDAKCANK